MADPETSARARLADLQADERRRMEAEAEPPYRPLVREAEVVDFAAFAARFRAELLSAADRAAAAAEREETARALLVRCERHDAKPNKFCVYGDGRGRRTVEACERRRQLGRAQAERAVAEARAREEAATREAISVHLYESNVPGKLRARASPGPRRGNYTPGAFASGESDMENGT